MLLRVHKYLNKNYKFGIILAAIGVVFLSAILFLYDNYSTEALYRRGIYTPFWTMLENSTEEVRIRQGETITMPVELHYWNGLKTLLGIQFEEPEAEQGGLYNPPDGLTILLDVDGAYFEVYNGRIVDVLAHRDVTLPVPDKIEQHMEGNMVVAKIGTITISVSDEVPAGDYYFGIKTTDANVGAVYEGNSQLLAVKVIEGDANEATTVKSGSYPISIGNRTYDIGYSFSRSEGALKSIAMPEPAAAMIVDVDAVDDTDLDIVLPRKFLEQLEIASGYHYCVGNEFVVFLNDIPAHLFFRDTDDGQILTIPLSMGSNTVEIIGTDLLQSPTTCLHVGLEHYSFVKNLTGVEVDTWDEAVATARDYLDNLAQSNGQEKGANRGGPIGSVELVYLHANGTAFGVNRYDGTLEDVYPYFNHTPRNSYFWIVTLNQEDDFEKPEYVFTIDAQTAEVRDLVVID